MEREDLGQELNFLLRRLRTPCRCLILAFSKLLNSASSWPIIKIVLLFSPSRGCLTGLKYCTNFSFDFGLNLLFHAFD